MKTIIIALLLLFSVQTAFLSDISMKLVHPQTVDSLGACQGVSFQQGRLFVYGDREVGVIREYRLHADSLQFAGKEIRLTMNGRDLINHPTGIAFNGQDPVFIGNSIRLNAEGTLWKAVIYCVDWAGLQNTGTLDGNLINTIEDDACIQGTRPEYIQYGNKWYVATADYGGKNNEVRLYDPVLLKTAAKTSEKNILYKKFSCSPWVQNLHWVKDQGILVLIQNQVEGRKWRFSFLDLEQSLKTGKEAVIRVIDLDRNDELEGFTFLDSGSKGIATTSSRRGNINLVQVTW